MPFKLKILQDYSYKQGKELLQQKKPVIFSEIERLITESVLPGKSKISREKGKAGRMVWSGKDLRPLEATFRASGWRKEKIDLGGGNFVEIRLMKDRVGISLQFGKYSFVDTDFVKFEIFYLKERLEIGVEVVPTKAFRASMYSGPADFDQVIARLKARGEISPVPMWIVGVSPFGL